MYRQYITSSLFAFTDNKRLTISYEDYKNRVLHKTIEREENADEIISNIMNRYDLKFAGKEDNSE